MVSSSRSGGCVSGGFGLLGRGRCVVLVGVVVVLGVLVFVGGAVGAVERPKVVAEDSASVVGAPSTEAVFRGVLNPGGEGEAGTYKFLYNPSKTGACTGGLETAEGVGPASGEREEQSQTISGLTPDTQYAVCVRVENNAKTESSTSPAVSFVTFPEAPESKEANPVGDYTATLKGVLAPNASAAGEPGSYEFVYRQSPSECQGPNVYENKTAPAAAETAAGEPQEAVEASLSGLSSGTQYTFCLLERNTTGGTAVGSPVTFQTLGAGITSEQASTVEANAATLQASIDPDESATTYHFEYDTTPYTSSTAHGTSITSEGIDTEASIGSGNTPVPVEVRVTGLQPSTTYYYRVLATNEAGEKFDGTNKTLTTPAPAGSTPPQGCENEKLREEQPYGLALPDCRAYEMVSPTNTNGQDATAYRADYTARASEAPEGTEPAITYSAKGSYRNPEGALVENQYLSRRTPKGWRTQNITPLSSAEETEEHKGSYPTTYFTPELTAGLAVTSAQLGDAPPLVKEYGIYVAQFASHAYQYVGPTPENEPPWGASTDLGRVVLTKYENESLFESVGGTDVPVSVTNTEEPMSASVGSPTLSNVFAAYKDGWHAVSEDGSRVFFTTPPHTQENGAEAVGQLFVRVNIDQPHVGKEQSELNSNEECTEPAKACTIEVSASKREPEDPLGPRSARYWGASANGGKVFFTSKAELTDDANTGNPESCKVAPEPSEQQGDCDANLYEYNVETGVLADLTVDTEPPGAAVQGVVQISEDGSYVYFVADGKLATGAVEGAPNLYVTHDGGAPSFIATLAPKDQTDWQNFGIKEAGPEINTAVVTPSGGELAFVSERSLTTANFPSGYDNEQATAGECETELEDHEDESGMCREVYLYDSETQSLVCASCNPFGARPVGPSSIPGPAAQVFADYRPRDLISNGALFFESKDALASGSPGGRRNVYEFEGGSVHAISDAAGGYESFFLDASPNGENVFFASADRLLPEDPGGNTVVWDARTDGGYPAAPMPTSCSSGESCEPPAVTPPVVEAPESATFSGPGNAVPPAAARVVPSVKPKPVVQTRAQKLTKALTVCRRDGARKKRFACEKTARKRYGAKKKAKNATSERRASR